LSLKLEEHISNFHANTEVNQKRKQVSDVCFEAATKVRGLFRLTIPTGGGKTLSSLRFALNHALFHSHNASSFQRIIYLVPYTTILEQNAEEVRKILDPDHLDGRVVLEHHSNILPERETAWSKIVSENWDAPIIFSTMVQFLEGAFGSGTRAARRFHTLANAVIVFDEIQTLMPRCVHLFNLLVRFLTEICGSTVVLCTATQPSFEKMEKVSRMLPIGEENEIYKDRHILFSALNRVNVVFEKSPKSLESIASITKAQLSEYDSVLVVVNRKDTAGKLYEMLKNTPDTMVYHLTTGMCAAHRLEVLDHIRPMLRVDSGQRVICVSTNLIEAGVDISFGSAIRLLAGLDSIAQTAGRVNRHGERACKGLVTVVELMDEDLKHLPLVKKGANESVYINRCIEKYPEAFPNRHLGIEAQKLYSDRFFMTEKDLDYRVGNKSPVERNDDLFRILSDNSYAVNLYKGNNSQQYPPMPMHQSFAIASQIFHAIDSYTRGIIVPFRRGKEIIEILGNKDSEYIPKYDIIRESQRYTIGVPEYKLDDYLHTGVIFEVAHESGIYALTDNAYHDEVGFCTDFYSNHDVYMS